MKTLLDEGNVNVIDVRNAEDYEISHIPGAISIPKAEISNNLEKLSKDKVDVVYCYNQQCHLGACAALILTDYDYQVMLLEDGLRPGLNTSRFATV